MAVIFDKETYPRLLFKGRENLKQTAISSRLTSFIQSGGKYRSSQRRSWYARASTSNCAIYTNLMVIDWRADMGPVGKGIKLISQY